VTFPLQFASDGEDLNAHGLFMIEEPGTPATTARLLINNTAAVNNQTVVPIIVIAVVHKLPLHFLFSVGLSLCIMYQH
jgi:hypothetical protein